MSRGDESQQLRRSCETEIESYESFSLASVDLVLMYCQKLSKQFPDCSPDALIASATSLAVADMKHYGQIDLEAEYTPIPEEEGVVDLKIRSICRGRRAVILDYRAARLDQGSNNTTST